MEYRKLHTAIEETFGDMDRMTDEPLRKVAAIAVANRGRLSHRVSGPSKDDIKGEDGLI